MDESKQRWIFGVGVASFVGAMFVFLAIALGWL